MASPLLHMTLKIKPAKVMKTPRGIISKPFFYLFFFFCRYQSFFHGLKNDIPF